LTLLAVPFPHEVKALQREERIDLVDRPGVRGDQVGEPAGGDRGRVAAELGPDVADDPVDLAGEAVDDPRLERGDRRLPDHRLRPDEVDLAEARRPGEERVHRDLDARREYPADVLARGRHDVEVRGRAEVDDDAGRAV